MPENIETHAAATQAPTAGASLSGNADVDGLDAAAQFARRASWGLALCLVILWPVPMYISGYVFSSSFFTFWVALGLTWAFVATIAVVLYPVSPKLSPKLLLVGCVAFTDVVCYCTAVRVQGRVGGHHSRAMVRRDKVSGRNRRWTP